VGGRSISVSLQRLDVYVSLAAFAVLAASLARSEREKLDVIIALAAAGFVAALYGLWQYAFGFERTAQYVAQFGAGPLGDPGHAKAILEQKRIFSTTFSPDMFAGLMAALVPIAFMMSLKARVGKDNAVMAFGLVTSFICTIALYLTGSLGGWLSLGAGLFFFAIAAMRRSRKQVIAALVMIAVIVTLAGAIVLRRSETFTQLDHPHNPIVQRLNYWKGGIKLFASDPLMGVGPGHFGPAYLSIKPEKAGASRFAHNAVVQNMAETGAPGALGFILVTVAFLTGAVKMSRKDRIWAGLLGAGCAFLAHSMIDYDTEIIEVAAVFWVFLGLVAPHKPDEERKPRRISRAVVAGCVSIVILFEVLSAVGAFFMEEARWNSEKGEFASAAQAVGRSRWFRGMDPAQAKLEAEVFVKSGRDVKPAEAALKRLVTLDSLDPLAWMELAGFYMRKGDWALAEETLDRALELYPTYNVALAMRHFSRAHSLMGKGNLKGARRELTAVLKYFPKHKGALGGLNHIDRLEKERENQ